LKSRWCAANPSAWHGSFGGAADCRADFFPVAADQDTADGGRNAGRRRAAGRRAGIAAGRNSNCLRFLAVGRSQEEKKPQPQVFSRGKFTFNKRFIETKFAGFIGEPKGDAKTFTMEIKTLKETIAVECIKQVGATEAILETPNGQVTVPFADIQEIKLNPKTRLKYRSILMFGAPGSGKGTHGKILGAIPNFFHCACGDVFRNLRPKRRSAKCLWNTPAAASLVPDEPTIELWRQFIENSTQIGPVSSRSDTLVLDGIPRNVAQAEMLEERSTSSPSFTSRPASRKLSSSGCSAARSRKTAWTTPTSTSSASGSRPTSRKPSRC
jgi:hypothetical protein